MEINGKANLLMGNDTDYILFKVAIDLAKEGKAVWFISEKPFNSIPDGIDHPSKATLQLITFIYLEDYQELINYLNGIQDWKQLPNVVILNNFDKYTMMYAVNADCHKIAFLMANLLDCINFMSQKNKSATHLLVCMSKKGFEKENYQPNMLQVLLDMYFDNIICQTSTTLQDVLHQVKMIF